MGVGKSKQMPAAKASGGGKSNWAAKSAQFRNAMRAARGAKPLGGDQMGFGGGGGGYGA